MKLLYPEEKKRTSKCPLLSSLNDDDDDDNRMTQIQREKEKRKDVSIILYHNFVYIR